MKNHAGRMAFGGMMTAVAVVIMSLGSLIPVNTYVCPVLCILIHRLVLESCGRRLGWCYYMAVAVLSLLLAPDREAALVYLCLGDYPMIRPGFQRIRNRAFCTAAKLTFFTLAGAASYGLLMLMMGVDAVMAEYRGASWLLAVTVILWDVLFLLVDKLLDKNLRKIK